MDQLPPPCGLKDCWLREFFPSNIVNFCPWHCTPTQGETYEQNGFYSEEELTKTMIFMLDYAI